MTNSTAKRIRRRRIGDSVTTRVSERNQDDAKLINRYGRLQLLLVGGIIYLAITLSSSNTICINAFPFQHHSSTMPRRSSQILEPSTTPTPWSLRWDNRNPCFRSDSQNSSPPQICRLQRILLKAQSSNFEENDTNEAQPSSTRKSATAALINATIDAGNIASMDPEYQKYKESLLFLDAAKYKNVKNVGEAENLFQEFENYYDETNSESSEADGDGIKEKEEKTKGLAKSISLNLSTEPTLEQRKEEQKQEEEKNLKLTNPKAVRPLIKDIPIHMRPLQGFNVVLTHCTADFDSLASAVGLAKLWTSKRPEEAIDSDDNNSESENDDYDCSTDNYPTFVVLPRGAHPAVQRFLALHKHLFPIRSLKSLPKDLDKLHRLALVDAQRKDRIGPAESLLPYADRITVVDHHVDMESDIPGITDYVVDGVGSVSTLIVERLIKQQEKQLEYQLQTSSSPIPTLTEAEATLLALGIHADTGSLSFDSTTPRDASALAWVMHQGASQVAIAEHAQSSLSREQQAVLTQALVNANATEAHGVTVSTVLLTADGFINGLAAVAQDAMELSSSDVFLLGVVYEPKSGRGGKSKRKTHRVSKHVQSKLFSSTKLRKPKEQESSRLNPNSFPNKVLSPSVQYKAELAKVAEENRLVQERLRYSFDQKDLDGNGFIDRSEMTAALVASGIVATEDTVVGLMKSIDTNQDGMVDFDEFSAFANNVKALNHKQQQEQEQQQSSPGSEESKSPSVKSPSSTLIIIGRAKPGVNMKSVKLGKLLEKYGGGGHPKAASATVRLQEESQAQTIMSGLVDELIETSLQAQSTVGDFMTSPVLSVKADNSEKQVEDLFNRYDVRALPVVNEDNEVIGLVTYKEVSAAKQRMWNKEQKRLRQEQQRKEQGLDPLPDFSNQKKPTVKAWMKQHIKTVEASMTMAEVEAILLENDVGCIPVVMDGTQQLVGMVTRTDLLRQHRYYPSLHYDNKGMSDSLASRKHIVALRKKLKQFDVDE